MMKTLYSASSQGNLTIAEALGYGTRCHGITVLPATHVFVHEDVQKMFQYAIV